MIHSAITKIIILAFNLCFKAAMIDGVVVLGREPIKVKKQNRTNYMMMQFEVPPLNGFVYINKLKVAGLKIKNNVKKTGKQEQLSLTAFVQDGESRVGIGKKKFNRRDKGKYQIPLRLFWT